MDKSKENCIFCKIVNKEIPCAEIYEDNKFMAFLDIHPVVKGHTLVIPKIHQVWMHESSDELIAETFIMAKKIMNVMIKGLPCDYVQVTVVGKDVPHLHIHLMPRYFNDDLATWPTFPYRTEEEKKKYQEKIKSGF